MTVLCRPFLAFILAAVILAAPAQAQETDQITDTAPPVVTAPAPQQKLHTAVRLFSPVMATGTEAAVPAAVEVTMEEGWKIYWRTPGDAGLPPSFDWTGSENLADARVQWPVPHRFTLFDIDNLGYKNRVVLPVVLTPAESGAEISLQAKIDLLVCSDICVPETHTASLRLPAGEAVPSADAAIYQSALPFLPRKDDTDGAAVFRRAFIDYDSQNRNFLVVEMAAAEAPAADADLFVEHVTEAVFGKPVISHDAAKKTLTLRAPVHSTVPTETLVQSLSQDMLTLTYADGKNAGGIEGHLTLSPRPADLPVKGAKISEKLQELDLRFLLLALLGGLILNLMPCVLPVLSLKILSVVSHGGKDDRMTILRNFMASAAGILFSFWLIAGVLVAVKAAGGTIGWGIQFQHPGFLLFLITVLLLFAANLWGFFEIPLPRFIANRIAARHENEPTLAGHFLTGAFATLLATPCTAPFLGTAVGFALARGPLEIFVIFTFLGLGLALPYIVLAFSPGVFRFMPKPGAWMKTLQKVLSFALFLTAVWLASVLLAITTTPALDKGWEKFDAALIAPAVAEGRTVIVDVTADWCITCKANKRFVLETDTVTAALAADNILRLQADWTQRDEDIAAYLRQYGRFGIPFNIVYGPNAPEGIILPELLSTRAVLDALIEAAGE